jgi:hypothetical protein
MPETHREQSQSAALLTHEELVHAFTVNPKTIVPSGPFAALARTSAVGGKAEVPDHLSELRL